jgi:uncharacterized protein YjiS (DUF1127 family)
MSTLDHRRAAERRPANDNLAPRPPFPIVDSSAFVELGRRLSQMWRRHRSRQSLATLSDFELRDIGLTRAEVISECAKPFWRE